MAVRDDSSRNFSSAMALFSQYRGQDYDGQRHRFLSRENRTNWCQNLFAVNRLKDSSDKQQHMWGSLQRTITTKFQCKMTQASSSFIQGQITTTSCLYICLSSFDFQDPFLKPIYQNGMWAQVERRKGRIRFGGACPTPWTLVKSGRHRASPIKGQGL